jgi:hypothetical protein
LTKDFCLSILGSSTSGEKSGYEKISWRKDPMKKNCLFFVFFSFLVFSLAGVSYGWQGRMAGMGDPYGLVQDESDFLIHPAGIADGKGINFYSNYRFTFQDVTDWNYSFDFFDASTGALLTQYNFNSSGDEREHEGLLGAAFPLGMGRMGLFFRYSGRRNDYGGDTLVMNIPIVRYGMDSDLDAFDLRLLYGLPMGGFKLGGEIQLAYRHEKNDTNMWVLPGGLVENYPVGGLRAGPLNLFQFMYPYDSKYWEAIFKGSLKGAIGPVKVDFTLRGGFIFSGENHLMFMEALPPNLDGFNLGGNVKGWNIGGDFWLQYPLANDFSLPFLLRVDYQKKTRDGDGLGVDFTPSESFVYKNREKNLQLEVGGGVDKKFGKGTRIAAGIYYGFLQNTNDYLISGIPSIGSSFVYNLSKYPDQTERRVILGIAGEKEVSPMIAMRMGLNLFYGWVNDNFNAFYRQTSFAFENQSIDGSHWGIVASLGGTVKFQQLSFEPFIGGGYQKWDLDGTGFASGTPSAFINMDKMRKEWSIGGGLSIKF